MSRQTRPKPTLMTVCDLCDKEISESERELGGALTHEYGRPVSLPKTKHAWLIWPGPRRERQVPLETRIRDKEKWAERRYDFHGECLLSMIEDVVAARPASLDKGGEGA